VGHASAFLFHLQKDSKVVSTLQRSLAAGMAWAQALAREMDVGMEKTWGELERSLGPAVPKHALLPCSESTKTLSHTVSKLCYFGLVQDEILPRSAGCETKGQTLTLDLALTGFKFHRLLSPAAPCPPTSPPLPC